MKNIIHTSPNWLYEAAACIAEQQSNNLELIIDGHDKFGMTKDELYDALSKYREYKNVVLSKIIPIYNKYPNLHKYFKDSNLGSGFNNPISLSMAMYFGKDLSTSTSHEEIDYVINEYILDIARELATNIENEAIKLNGLEDVLNLLDKANIEDSSKLLLINLYHNRYKFIEELAELLQQCVPICKEYFSFIEEDFQKALKLLNETKNLSTLLNSNSSIKLNIADNSEIYSSIFTFNQFSIIEGKDGFVIYVGIYFFEYVNLKSKNRFNDTQIITDLKALGDTTRLKIVHLLIENKMYVQELAKALELTSATVSHHINTLLKSELITITLDTERPKTIYYEVNAEKIQSLGETIKSIGSIASNT